jgi:hypothetical protein
LVEEVAALAEVEEVAAVVEVCAAASIQMKS